jgi:hypothetical protein
VKGEGTQSTTLALESLYRKCQGQVDEITGEF